LDGLAWNPGDALQAFALQGYEVKTRTHPVYRGHGGRVKKELFDRGREKTAHISYDISYVATLYISYRIAACEEPMLAERHPSVSGEILGCLEGKAMTRS
jgi:hypothetical protein